MFVLLPFFACHTEISIKNQFTESTDEIIYENHEEVATESFLSDLAKDFYEDYRNAEPMIYNEALYSTDLSTVGVLYESTAVYLDLYKSTETSDCPRLTSTDSIVEGCTTDDQIYYNGRINLGFDRSLEYRNFSIQKANANCSEKQDSITYNGGIIYDESTLELQVLLRIDNIRYDKSCTIQESTMWYESHLEAEFDDLEEYYYGRGPFNGTSIILQV